MAVSLRPYRESDFDAVTRIWCEGQASTGLGFSSTLEHLRERWALQRAAGCYAYVAERGGVAAGFITYEDGEVKQLYVDPGCQGQGIGKLLLDHAKREMPRGFRLTTALESRAPKFYEREGLVRGETGMHPRYGHRTVHFTWIP